MLDFIKWVLKWLVIIIGLIIVSHILITFSPLFFFISVAAFWYFTLINPNERGERYAIKGAMISMISFVLLVYILHTEGVIA